MDEEDKHTPSEVCYPEDLETLNAETEFTSEIECHTTKLARVVLWNIGPWSNFCFCFKVYWQFVARSSSINGAL